MGDNVVNPYSIALALASVRIFDSCAAGLEDKVSRQGKLYGIAVRSCCRAADHRHLRGALHLHCEVFGRALGPAVYQKHDSSVRTEIVSASDKVGYPSGE